MASSTDFVKLDNKHTITRNGFLNWACHFTKLFCQILQLISNLFVVFGVFQFHFTIFDFSTVNKLSFVVFLKSVTRAGLLKIAL